MTLAPALDPNALLYAVLELRVDVDRAAERRMAAWGVADAEPPVRASAENLARYLVLRRRDLAGLQRALVELGLSSLGRSEARVRPQLDPDVVARLIRAGADGVRINAAHDGPEAWRSMAAPARAAAAAQGRSVFVEVDLAGPKVRAADGAPAGMKRVGDALWLAAPGWRAAADRGEPTVGLTLPRLLEAVCVGEQVWFDDGRLGIPIEAIDVAVPSGDGAQRGGPGVAVLLRVNHVLRRGQRVRAGAATGARAQGRDAAPCARCRP